MSEKDKKTLIPKNAGVIVTTVVAAGSLMIAAGETKQKAESCHVVAEEIRDEKVKLHEQITSNSSKISILQDDVADTSIECDTARREIRQMKLEIENCKFYYEKHKILSGEF